MPTVGEAMAVKIVTLYHGNAGTDVPTHQAVVLIFDKVNGSPLATLYGRLDIEMRTAAGSAAAARKLAVEHPDVVSIMDNGVQARAHTEALRAVRGFQEFLLWARNEASGRKVAEEIWEKFVADPEQVVRDANIVAYTTSSIDPIVRGAWLKPGAFVASVGWNSVESRELDDAVMANTVLVESVDAAKDQAGDVCCSGCEFLRKLAKSTPVPRPFQRAPPPSTIPSASPSWVSPRRNSPTTR